MKVGDTVRDLNLHPSWASIHGGRYGLVLKIGELSPSRIDRSIHTRILVCWFGAPDPLCNGEHWCESGWLEVINESR